METQKTSDIWENLHNATMRSDLNTLLDAFWAAWACRPGINEYECEETALLAYEQLNLLKTASSRALDIADSAGIGINIPHLDLVSV